MSSSSGTPAFAGAGTGSGPGAGSAAFALTPPSLLEQVGAIARRSVMRTFRQRALLVFPLVFPLILFAINGSSLSAARKIPGFPDVSYRDFALAVPFIQGALFVAVTAGTDLARDIQSGFFDRLALTPLRGSALLVGQLGGAAVVACVQSVVYLLVGLATGVGVKSGVGGALVLLALSILIAFGFAGLGALIALRFGSGEAVQGIFPLLFVTVFLSSSSLPRNAIKTDWFRDVATYNPVSYLIEGIRSLIITGWDAQALALGFGFALALSTITLALAGVAMKNRLVRT
ncbi:MAG TPA: ABC transporter permease [Solirubrobacteraceae bacterium]|nr:ABC transporter permease [Solirubrobacteraceae bacterium]